MPARPKLTPEVHARFCKLLVMSNWKAVCARECGVSLTTYYKWMRLGKSSKPARAKYRAFRLDVLAIDARGEISLVGIIAGAARPDAAEPAPVPLKGKGKNAAPIAKPKRPRRGDWKAAAWLLERRYPTRWGRNRVEVTGKGGGAVETNVTLANFYQRLAATDEGRGPPPHVAR